MARKLKSESKFIHDFTRQIHSTKRTGTVYANMKNRNEKLAKENNALCCHDCRYFLGGCDDFIGKYHLPCEEFKWW